jgi:DNA-binding MarR family transcriptional regulator
MAQGGATQVRDGEVLEGLVRDDGGLTGLVGYHLRMANVALYRDFTGAMRDIGLTQRQYATLVLIAANPGIPQVGIAAYLDADRATIMALVDRLEGRALITRERSRTDRRRQELVLTGLGRTVLDEAKAVIARHEQRVTAGLSKAETASLIDLLSRLRG